MDQVRFEEMAIAQRARIREVLDATTELCRLWRNKTVRHHFRRDVRKTIRRLPHPRHYPVGQYQDALMDDLLKRGNPSLPVYKALSVCRNAKDITIRGNLTGYDYALYFVHWEHPSNISRVLIRSARKSSLI